MTTDLRHGVTETQHAVLDLIDQNATEWGHLFTYEQQLKRGADLARFAALSLDEMRAELADPNAVPF